IVSPGFSREVVSWCVENKVPVTPGCITPTEIMEAMSLGLKVLKFFPANVYGGLSAMKALSGPFSGIRFIPTGGVNAQNLSEYISAPFVHAVGGSWICPKADISAGNFDKITALCAEARSGVLGYELAHVGVNCADANESLEICREFGAAFGFPLKEGNSSNFSSSGIEVMKTKYLGTNGHIAIRTNCLPAAVADLEKRGFAADPGTAKYKGDKMTAIYLQREFGGFAVHLIQK
ncbi:MAG: keto-hydroxyglutarate-aldolase/keto-deoxy-phosphogluconate aldolase, partial [Oscillospiraceae bacterium]|nr:keto-hydroxyglutarate-aldolase/keto-deoxy-phosphogluconate aldolase [Oscillospiraceae bacterium]